jgi:hypothetical protein
MQGQPSSALSSLLMSSLTRRTMLCGAVLDGPAVPGANGCEEPEASNNGASTVSEQIGKAAIASGIPPARAG